MHIISKTKRETKEMHIVALRDPNIYVCNIMTFVDVHF
jgi:hypothetical protein